MLQPTAMAPSAPTGTAPNVTRGVLLRSIRAFRRARPTVKFLVSDAWTAVKPQSLERIVADTTSQIRIVRMLAAT